MVSFEKLLGIKEIKTMRFFRSTIAEVVGTAMLVIVGCGSVLTLNFGPGAETMAVAFSFGLALAMIIWLFGHISGAHVNPCVSIGFMVTGHVSVLKAGIYVVAQVIGGIIGAGLLKAVIPDQLQVNQTLGSTTLGANVTIWQGVIIEIIATFCLVMTVFASCDRLRTDHSGSIALAIGFCVTAMITWMGTLTGGSMNPARSLGPAIFSGTWKNHWIYWVAPIVGGTIAALMYEHVFAEQTRETNTELHTFEYNNLQMTSHGYLDYTLEIPPPPGMEDKVTTPLDFNKGRRFSLFSFGGRRGSVSRPS
uniref:Aquaporin n=1 Tax=Arion vulgaris TaxID=1028688 RepID=A0A0B7ARK2_9EUPU